MAFKMISNKTLVNNWLVSSLMRSPATVRTLSVSPLLLLKEIKVTVNANRTIVEGVKVTSPRAAHLAQPPLEANKEACSLCRLGIRRLHYTDVLILSQFIESNGKLMEFKDTGLCGGKYRLVKSLVRQAQVSRLLPRPPDFEVFGPWDNLNTYHDWPPRNRDQPMRIVKPEYWK